MGRPVLALAKEIKVAKQRGELLGLSEDEEAFYAALRANDSAVAVLGDDTLNAIAREGCARYPTTASVPECIKWDVGATSSVTADEFQSGQCPSTGMSCPSLLHGAA